ncbi:MAG: SET domain-containing protein-lysine N-methyltransferase [Maricaulis sp.]|jgi:SET domain-containing protein|nr:SET domain-containing protein-lysine N-methyltransferase [Maricaulis sp.]|tara:strand:- start:398 stop:820 length:423 start_codon:yes stop_codon:yes gene_type:complete
MLLVETYVDASAIEGVGVFAAQPVAKGTQVWRFEPTLDRALRAGEVQALPPAARAFLDRYAYVHPDDRTIYMLDGDHGRFMNHADDPNTDYAQGYAGFAVRDIAAGEELTCDYGQFYSSHEFLPSLTEKFGSAKPKDASK